MSKPKISSEKIMEIKAYVPGSYAQASDKKQIKLSSNENPFSCSSSVLMTINKELNKLNRYPDGGSTAVRKKLAELHGVDENRIICGAGSDEIITG